VCVDERINFKQVDTNIMSLSMKYFMKKSRRSPIRKYIEELELNIHF
jgi:hypothetical protein